MKRDLEGDVHTHGTAAVPVTKREVNQRESLQSK